MVEGKPSSRFWLVFALPFQQSEYDPGKLASQHYQRLSGSETASSLLFIEAFPSRCATSRHGGIVQKPAYFRVASFTQAAATVFLS
ncbi:hypothetical protein SAMN03159293_04521 [Pseudomonas sp. NFACC39-1]|nr:hypothetical protein SAMN03159293_02422 [Pseudomonas sp. NFACC39-1]SEO91131.1 hypothetical protein SAMN03159293_04389 [Pseudomonas sp. NFACC39-1]SEO95289.1 hypothetical protein SAMN03159293_04521 [Pseudomonas sp. NFACC39-1]